ncbi:uncharacterized protein LOC143516921 isoform X2 [Brachyhypopomus gauderio]
MCAVEMDLYSMATHVVGLKHRQKYLELKRPDLVTWQNNSQKQPGLVARAKAAVVEKQEGWGAPVPLKRPKEDRRPRKDNQGYRATEMYWSDTPEMPYPGQDRRGKPPMTEVACRSYLEDDTLGRHRSLYREEKYDGSHRTNVTHLRIHPEDDRGEIPYSQNGRQRKSYREDSHTEGPYVKEDNNLRSYPEDGGRSYVDRPVPNSDFQRWDERYQEVGSSRRQYSSGDMREDFYHGSVPKKRFAEMDVRASEAAQRPVEMHLDQENERMYASHEGRRSGMDEMQRLDRNFQYVGKEWDNFQAVERTRVGYFEAQTHQRIRDAVSDYPQESVPAKRKRKSRFSDASPLEMALAQKGQIEDLFEKTKKRGIIIPSNLENIQIENDEEANFLKEKLCTLLKEFQANKAQRSEQRNQASHSARDYNYMSGARVEQRREGPETRHVDRGLLESARYHESVSDYQVSRTSLRDDATGMQETWQFEEDPRDHGHVQDIRRYGKNILPEFTRYESESREQESRHFEDGVSRKGFEDSPRDVFQHSGPVKESRSIRNARPTRGEETRSYSEYEMVSHELKQHIPEGARRPAEGRYRGGDFRPSQHSFEWDPNRGGSAERSEDLKTHLPNDEQRGYRRVRLWDSKSLLDEEKVRVEGQTPRARYQRGGDPYDPCHPSSSPPQEVANSSSLEKLASTLLELMARNSN